MLRRHRQPEAPRNARLVYPDGTTIPLELYYEGTDDEGLAVWVATTKMVVPHDTNVQLLLDRLPSRTTVRLALDRP